MENKFNIDEYGLYCPECGLNPHACQCPKEILDTIKRLTTQLILRETFGRLAEPLEAEDFSKN